MRFVGISGQFYDLARQDCRLAPTLIFKAFISAADKLWIRRIQEISRPRPPLSCLREAFERWQQEKTAARHISNCKPPTSHLR